MIKKLLQYGADKNIKNNENISAIDLVQTKNKENLNELFIANRNAIANISFKKIPLVKIEKNNDNIILFLVLHFMIEILVTLFILRPFLTKRYYYGIIFSYFYFSLFIIMMIVYAFLIYSDPGLIQNTKGGTLLVILFFIYRVL